MMTNYWGIVAATLFAGYMGWQGYSIGQKVEMSKWQARIMEQEDAALKALTQQRELARSRMQEQQQAMIGALNERDREIERLSAANINLSTRGLYVKCPQSNNSRVPGTAEDTKVDGGAPGRVRLSQEDERRLISIADDAQRVVVQYNTCRAVLSEYAILE